MPHREATNEQNTVVQTTPIAAGIAARGSKYVTASVTARAVFWTPTTKVMKGTMTGQASHTIPSSITP